MKKLLTVAAVAEAATGVALIVFPSLVGRLLLGTELTGVSMPVARVLGIALIALGVACWPDSTALCGILTYGALATLYLLYLGIRGHWVGPLLWPVVVLHAVLTLLLARAWFKPQDQGPT
jgi:drug/metabolite transporter (DMT)-like permease